MNLLLNTLLVICFVAICYADLRWLIIPNAVNVAVLISGLIARAADGGMSVLWALASVVIAYSLMWLVRMVHFRLTGRIGLGMGDVKLASASAAWFSFWMFPLFIFLSSAFALLFILAVSLTNPQRLKNKIPFGPFLAASLIATWNIEPSILTMTGTAL
ncbi:prepilin peptidase [Agrobacterium sp. 22117]|uniref:prepilin peptidase n=1 Tax=Agrobacterium sp. 22117 TaxID=3453880 RepID=UPI003F84E719